MDNWQRAQEFLAHKEKVIDFLRRGNDDEGLAALFQRDQRFRELFQEKISSWIKEDPAVESAFQRALERAEGLLEEIFFAPVDRELSHLEWKAEDFTEKMMDQWRRENSNVISSTWVISRSDLPAAAGGLDELPHIPGSFLEGGGLPSQATILCHRVKEGYEIRLESTMPMRLIMAFFRGEDELAQVEVSEQIPEEPLPLKAIQGWNHVQLRKKI